MIKEPRPYRDDEDRERMLAILVEGRRTASPVYYVHPGDLCWWLCYLLLDYNLSEIAFLWEEPERGEVIGWSLLSPNFDAFDVFVHPRERGSRNMQRMLDWTVERAVQMVRRRGGSEVRTAWVGEQDDVLIGMLEQRRFVCASGHLVSMVRALREPVECLTLPSEYVVRPVRGEHEVGRRASVQYDAFRSARPFAEYQARYLRLMQSPVYRPELDIVAVAPDGQFAAFCIGWLDEVNRVGLFEPVGTRPAFLRQGLARAVMCEGLLRMQKAGMLSAIVCAEHNNAAALSLYESLGFRRAGRILTYARRL